MYAFNIIPFSTSLQTNHSPLDSKKLKIQISLIMLTNFILFCNNYIFNVIFLLQQFSKQKKIVIKWKKVNDDILNKFTI
jgi:hypothetical protein